jgi:hypothetical protein
MRRDLEGADDGPAQRPSPAGRAGGVAWQDESQHDDAPEGERSEDEGVWARRHRPKVRPRSAVQGDRA